MQKLTDIDLQIIEALRKDARSTKKRIALTMDVSEETVRRRVQQMVKSGVLQFDVNVSAEALGMPVQALINVEVDPRSVVNILDHSQHAHVRQIHDTVEGHQVYDIASPTLEKASLALLQVKSHPAVTRATITFLYPNGDNRI